MYTFLEISEIFSYIWKRILLLNFFCPLFTRPLGQWRRPFYSKGKYKHKTTYHHSVNNTFFLNIFEKISPFKVDAWTCLRWFITDVRRDSAPNFWWRECIKRTVTSPKPLVARTITWNVCLPIKYHMFNWQKCLPINNRLYFFSITQY